MDFGCPEDVAAPALPVTAAEKPDTAASLLDATPDKKISKEAKANAKKIEAAREKYKRLEDKWQHRTPLIQKEWGLNPADPKVQMAMSKSWLADKSDKDGKWLGVGCIACEAAALQGSATHFGGGSKTARAFKEFSVATEEALQVSNLDRHHRMPGHKESVLRFLGLRSPDKVDTSGAPAASDFTRVLSHVAKGSAASEGIPGIGDKGKILKMVFCIAEAKTRSDRDFVRQSAMISLRRDERAGRLALRCCAVQEKSFDRRCFFMSLQRGMGTGASNITKATEAAFHEFCQESYGAPSSKRGKAAQPGIDVSLLAHMREIHKQIIVDAASDERLSARQMKEAPDC